MKRLVFLLSIIFAAAFAMPANTYALWPTTVEENLRLSISTDTTTMQCHAIPFTDGSTLVSFKKGGVGMVYQIIDRYGQMKYEYPPKFLNVDFSMAIGYDEPYLVPDGEGGAYAAWSTYNYGTLAQRLDSLGNRVWGDSGRVISPFSDYSIAISPDGQGGLLLAISPDETDWTDLYVQRIDDEGNLLWGPQGLGVSTVPNSEARYPQITHGLQGDAYVSWQGSYGMWGAIYLQRISPAGAKIWHNDMLISEGTDKCRLLPDGEGGVIVQSNPGFSDYNTHWRIGPSGNIIWTKNHLSWYYSSQMTEGEPGYFYLGFNYSVGLYGQRVRISDGMNMWPSWSTGRYGALIANHPGWGQPGHNAYIYKSPYFYGVFDYAVNTVYPTNLYGQALDISGNRVLGADGVLMTAINTYYYYFVHIRIDDENGIVAVFEHGTSSGPEIKHILAKRANIDGTLGGPLPPVQDTFITLSGNDVVLTWNAMGDSVQYRIYKSAQPYVFPAIPDTVISDTTFIDVDALNEGMLFYSVRWEP
jgi:hypothetical protein